MDPHVNPASGVWDDNYYARTHGGGSSGGIFNYDYKKAAEDAYGELGPYYLRLLTESKGDLNKALARLTEDYDRGVRIRTEDTVTGNQADARGNVSSMLGRGLYQRSNFAPNTNSVFEGLGNPDDQGFGIADLSNPANVQGNQIRQRNLQTMRANEEASIAKARQNVDLPEEQRRREFALEQERREKSAGLAETRGARAFQDYQAKQLAAPTMV